MSALRRAALACLVLTFSLGALPASASNSLRARSVARGKYLAQIGVCSACHTPPKVSKSEPDPNDRSALLYDLQFRSDPNWTKYLDHSRELAGGVQFILRFGPQSHGIVYSSNITPDVETGIGRWTAAQIVKVLRTGKRPDGTTLFLFPPHSFYSHLSLDDAYALAAYLKAQPPIHNTVPPRNLPFGTPAMTPDGPAVTPHGNSLTRAKYLVRAIVGCRECHSYRDPSGTLHEFAGGDPVDPNTGVFRLGPDLPLRQSERGFATFPFPGYAVLYAPNLTRFGRGGDMARIRLSRLVGAIKYGVDVENDDVGKPERLLPVMMWHFYSKMRNRDAYAIARYLKSLPYEHHCLHRRLIYFGTDWEAAFRQVFGTAPSDEDKKAFGKK